VTPLANVPTLVLVGPGGAGKTTLISRLIAARSHAETWAVLANDRGAVHISPRDGVTVAEISGGCVCCTAQVALRVALTRLLREARPARLFVELDAAGHTRAALKTLRNPWLASVLAIEAVVGVFGDIGPPLGAAVESSLDSCDVVCVRGDPAAFLPLAAGKRVLDASRATLAALQGASVSDPR
jgi:ABC-type branched-subunit amino acid transport system ATPase component